MVINLIDKLYKSGELLSLIQCGFIPPNVLIYRKIYHLYNERINSGRKKMEAMDDIAFTFGYDQRQNYRILTYMRQEYEVKGKL